MAVQQNQHCQKVGEGRYSQWMLSGIPVYHRQVKGFIELENIGVWSINVDVFSILTHAELGEEGWHHGGVVSNCKESDS
jgi:hypothetical protein